MIKLFICKNKYNEKAVEKKTYINCRDPVFEKKANEKKIGIRKQENFVSCLILITKQYNPIKEKNAEW